MKQASTGIFSKQPMYDCKCDWPDDCFVQSGDEGLVFSPKGNYRTSFFEAFPRNPNTFIRGEGKTMEEAEQNAWKEFQKQSNCALDHTNPDNFDRRKMRNGLGFCKQCSVSLMIFEPLEKCCNCGKATYFTYDLKDNWWCEECKPLIPEEDRRKF
jgi:hypothetical protein